MAILFVSHKLEEVFELCDKVTILRDGRNACEGVFIKELDKQADKDRIKQLSSLKTMVEHDINIDELVEQDIDIEEKGVNIDLKDFKEK